MDFFIPTVSIIGLGEVGSLIASLVNMDKENIDINIMDPSGSIEGRLLDLKHASIPKSNKIHLNDTNLLGKSQVIFHTAGVRGKIGENRNNKALDNLNIIKDVYKGVTFKDSALIVNISNPVEATAQWIHEATAKKLKIIGTGTLLDTYRLKAILSTHFDVPYSLVETMVIGEHGSKMIPIWTQTKIRGKKITTLVNDEQLDKFTEELKAAASKIRSTESATKYGVAQTAIELANQYFSKEEAILPFAFDASTFLGDNIFINWPCRISRQQIIPCKFKLNDVESLLWNSAIDAIGKTTSLKATQQT